MLVSPSSTPPTYDFRFNHPATHYVSGPSTSGKTFRTGEILRHKDDLLRGGDKILNVVFCYDQWQPSYDDLKSEGLVTRWENKMPTVDEFSSWVSPSKHKGGSIVVIDDFMSKIGDDLDQIFRVTGRHLNASVFVLLQSLFPPQKMARQISLNTKYMHIHKNIRENAQFATLARQLRPHDYQWLVAAYHQATQPKYSCLLLDLTQECEEKMRVRSCYLPSEQPMIIYTAK